MNNSSSFISDGVKISYEKQGQGQPVVLVHGFGLIAESQFGLPGVTRSLAEEFQVISFDARGHGASERPMDAKAYGYHMITDIVNLLDHLEIDRAHIVGYSMGGIITTKFMTRYPERVIKAVPCGQGWMNADEMDHLNMPESLLAGTGFEPMIRWLTPDGQEPPSAEIIDRTNAEIFSVNDPEVLASVWQGFDGLNITADELRGNQVEALYIVGELDPLRRYVDRLKGTVRNASYLVIPGTDHVTTPFHPLFVKGIKDFISIDHH